VHVFSYSRLQLCPFAFNSFASVSWRIKMNIQKEKKLSRQLTSVVRELILFRTFEPAMVRPNYASR